MAKKATYIYKIGMGYQDPNEEIAFVYARNSSYAINACQEQFKEKKYSCFKATMFGEADVKLHPGPVEAMSEEEIDLVIQNRIAEAEAYAQRKERVE